MRLGFGGELETDRAGRARGDERQRVEQGAAKDVRSFELHRETSRGAQKQTNAFRHDVAHYTVRTMIVGREKEIFTTICVQHFAELGERNLSIGRDERHEALLRGVKAGAQRRRQSAILGMTNEPCVNPSIGERGEDLLRQALGRAIARAIVDEQ